VKRALWHDFTSFQERLLARVLLQTVYHVSAAAAAAAAAGWLLLLLQLMHIVLEGLPFSIEPLMVALNSVPAASPRRLAYALVPKLQLLP